MIETARLRVPPQRSGSGLSLACQCRGLGDIECEKHRGLWGHRAISDEAMPSE